MNLNQFNIIAALNNYKEAHSLNVERFNQGGICIALAMCFARAHLVEPSAIESPEIFEDFLLKWQTKDGIKIFFEEYEFLKSKMLQSKKGLIQLSIQERQELAMNLAKLETQMAYYNTAVMLYAQHSSDYYIGLQNSYHLRTLQFAGLDFTGGGAAFSLSPEELDLFFFAKDAQPEASIISPFSPGGTYVLRLPGHACALHVASNGDIKFYDPNRQSYMTSREELESYKNYFRGFYGQNQNLPNKVQIMVYSVDLIDKTLGKKNSQQYLQEISEQINKSTERLLHQFNIHSQECLSSSDFWINLFFNRSAFSQMALKNIMIEFGPIAQARTKIFSAALSAFKETRNSQLFDIILNEPLLTQDEFNKMIASANSSQFGGHALSYLITHVPAHLSLLPDNQISIRNSLKAALNHPIDGWAQSLVEALFNKNGANEALKQILAFNEPQISHFAIEQWVRFHKQQGCRSGLFLQNAGLLTYMIANNFPQKNILAFINSDTYIISQDDYDFLLKSEYQQAKKALLVLEQNNLLPGISPASPLVKAVLTDDGELTCKILSENGLGPFLLEDKFNAAICAVTAGNQQLLALILQSLDNKEHRQSLGSKALAMAVLSGNASLAVFLVQELHMRILPADEALFFAIPDTLGKAIQTGEIQHLDAWFALSAHQPHLLDIPKNNKGESLLILAINSNQFALAHALLNNGASSLQHDGAGNTPLIKSIQTNNLELVWRLASSEGLNATDQFGYTAAMYAIMHNKPKELEILLSRSPDLENRTGRGETALMIAAKNSPEGLKILLAHGLGNISERDFGGRTALMHAVMTGTFDSAKILIERGAALDLLDNDGHTALTLCDNSGSTLLMQAIENFDEELAETLIKAGANCESINLAGQSTFLLAVKEAFPLVPLILSRVPSDVIDAVNNEGEFALGLVSCYQKNIKLKVLLEAGANVCTVNKQGETALMMAASAGALCVCEELLLPKYAHAINIQDGKGNTALMKAVLSINKPVEKLKLLLNVSGVDVSLSNNQGHTALMIAATAPLSSAKLVPILLEHAQCEINKADKDGNTALILAIKKNNTEAVKILINSGADIGMKNHLGESALDLAAKNGVQGAEILAAVFEAVRTRALLVVDSSRPQAPKANSLYTRSIIQRPPSPNPETRRGA